jgi:monothiol glutaredoxin
MADEDIRRQVHDHIKQAIEGQHVMLFMKGTPDQPGCGFSARVVAALDALGTEYAAMDILPHPVIRQELSALSGWPTIPQLFVDGELVGGCDIVMEMYESGELAETLEVASENGASAAMPVEAEREPQQQPRPIQIGE